MINVSPSIYLDYNATVPLLPGVLEAMREAFMEPANPSALHRWGQQAKRWVNQAKKVLADYVEASPDKIIMTSGGTEANNLVLQGRKWDKVFMSVTAHDSSYKVLETMEEISVDSNGLMKIDELDSKLSALAGGQDSPSILVSVIHAHNESGVIQPLEEIVSVIRRHGALLHVDATQSLGKIPCSFKKFGADFLTVSAHKIGGPQGVGALIVRDLTLLCHPMMRGGGQEQGYRSGTENVSGIVGFSEALKRHSMDHFSYLERWHRGLEKTLVSFAQSLGDDVYIYGAEVVRLPNTTCLTMPYGDAVTQVMRFDLEGVGVSMGAACSSGRTQVSRSLKAMGPDPSYAERAIRLSSGWKSQESDFSYFCDVWKKIYQDFKRSAMSHVS